MYDSRCCLLRLIERDTAESGCETTSLRHQMVICLLPTQVYWILNYTALLMMTCCASPVEAYMSVRWHEVTVGFSKRSAMFEKPNNGFNWIVFMQQTDGVFFQPHGKKGFWKWGCSQNSSSSLYLLYFDGCLCNLSICLLVRGTNCSQQWHCDTLRYASWLSCSMNRPPIIKCGWGSCKLKELKMFLLRSLFNVVTNSQNKFKLLK